MDNVHASFKAHRSSAESRGIPFRFTFAEWWSVWAPHWARRHLDNLCMCRNGDEGDYALGNVYIATRVQNAADWQANRAAAQAVLNVNAPEPAATTSTLRERIDAAELSEFLTAFRESGGNLAATARKLGITYRTARYILQKRGMSKDDAIAQMLI